MRLSGRYNKVITILSLFFSLTALFVSSYFSISATNISPRQVVNSEIKAELCLRDVKSIRLVIMQDVIKVEDLLYVSGIIDNAMEACDSDYKNKISTAFKQFAIALRSEDPSAFVAKDALLSTLQVDEFVIHE